MNTILLFFIFATYHCFAVFYIENVDVPTARSELKKRYYCACQNPSDINEHVCILRGLAKECSSVVEIGLRSMVSSWGILQGLSESSFKNRSYCGIDLNSSPIDILNEAKYLAEGNGISFHFWQANDMEIDIEPTDLLFIDSLHTYCHLSYELEKFSSKVSKYIVMHDTNMEDVDDFSYQGNCSEYPLYISRKKKGLWPAVLDFLKTHPEWEIYDRRLNNYGLTILKRVDEDRSKEVNRAKISLEELYKEIERKNISCVTKERFATIDQLARTIQAENIEGDIVECGIWKGGMSIYMAYSFPQRRCWALDSFQGFESLNQCKYDPKGIVVERHYDGICIAPEWEVRQNFAKMGLDSSKGVEIIPGWVNETTDPKNCPIEKIALLRIDVDAYSATLVVLENFYDKIVPGGYIIFDDTGLYETDAAIRTFEKKRGVEIISNLYHPSGIHVGRLTGEYGLYFKKI